MERSPNEPNDELSEALLNNETKERLNRCLEDGRMILSDQDLELGNCCELANWMQENAASVKEVTLLWTGDNNTGPEILVYLANRGLSKWRNLVQLELATIFPKRHPGVLVSTAGAVITIEAILKALSKDQTPFLQRFQLEGKNMQRANIQVIIEALVEHLPNVTTLGITRKELVAIAPFLLLSDKSLCLIVSRNDEVSKGGGVRFNRCLKSLDLVHCGIDNVQCMALAECLKEVGTSLTQLDLGGNGIGDEGAEALGAALSTSRESLDFLSLPDNDIGDKGVAALARAISTNHRSLKHLDLSANGIGDEGGVALAHGLSTSHESLQSLNLSHNHIVMQGLEALAAAIGTNHTLLETLHLAGNQMQSGGAREVAKVIRNHKSLTELNLHDNRIDSWGASALAEMLARNSALKILRLYGNARMTEQDFMSFGHAMKHNRILERLELGYRWCIISRSISWFLCVQFFTACNSIHFGMPCKMKMV